MQSSPGAGWEGVWENPNAKFTRYRYRRVCGRTLMQSSPGAGWEGVWENPNAKFTRYR